MNDTRDKMLNSNNDIPKKLEESLRNQTLAVIEIELEDVKLSLEEIAMALESAKAKKISKKQAFRNAQWERIRRYHDYFDYDNSTPSHKYIYMHDFF